MAKKATGKRSLIGAVGATLIGAALLFFIMTIIMGSLKTINVVGDVSGNETTNPGRAARMADWNSSNDTVDTILVFATISTILLGVMGITMVGASIIGYITGAF